MSIKPLALMALTIATFGISSAAGAQDYARAGVYAGFGLGLGFDNFEEGPAAADFDPGTGIDAWVGYRVLPNLAAEVQVEYLPRFGAELSPVVLQDNRVVTYTTNLKGYLATGPVQPFLLFGTGILRAENELSGFAVADTSGKALGFAARFGGGVDFYTTESVSLGVAASYVLTTGNVDGFDYISVLLGLQYRF